MGYNQNYLCQVSKLAASSKWLLAARMPLQPQLQLVQSVVQRIESKQHGL